MSGRMVSSLNRQRGVRTVLLAERNGMTKIWGLLRVIRAGRLCLANISASHTIPKYILDLKKKNEQMKSV